MCGIRHLAIIAKGTTRLARGPGTINFSYDRTCNLACPSCRNGLIILAGQEKEKARQIHEKVLGKHLADAERLIVTGSGDPFISKFYLPFLRGSMRPLIPACGSSYPRTGCC